jgi:hypothetical protein
MLQRLRTQVDTYAAQKTWYWYVPLWLFGLYLFLALLDFELGGEMPFVLSIMYAANFLLHELAHIMLSFLPEILVAAAGSLSEILLGGFLIFIGIKGKTYFASLFGFLWFMLSTQSAADYMADARTQAIPLVTPGGGDPIHDWNFVFDKLGLLDYDVLIGHIVRTSGSIVGLFGLVFSAWVIYRIAVVKPTSSMSDDEAELLHATALTKGLHAAPPQHFKQVQEDLYPTAISGPLVDRDSKDDSKRTD